MKHVSFAPMAAAAVLAVALVGSALITSGCSTKKTYNNTSVSRPSSSNYNRPLAPPKAPPPGYHGSKSGFPSGGPGGKPGSGFKK